MVIGFAVNEMGPITDTQMHIILHAVTVWNPSARLILQLY